MTVEFEWTRTSTAIPSWELTRDPAFFVEQWGTGSYAAYHGKDRTGGRTYGTRDQAMMTAEAEYRAWRAEADAGHALEGRVS